MDKQTEEVKVSNSSDTMKVSGSDDLKTFDVELLFYITRKYRVKAKNAYNATEVVFGEKPKPISVEEDFERVECVSLYTIEVKR